MLYYLQHLYNTPKLIKKKYEVSPAKILYEDGKEYNT
jgi:hypothetical protein